MQNLFDIVFTLLQCYVEIMLKAKKYELINIIITFILSSNLLVVINLQASELQKFDIWEFKVEGNTLLQSSDIESALYPYLGANKTLNTVEQAKEFLQRSYKAHGYPIVVVNIPEQNVIGGIVTLSVIEGKIDRLRISGNQYFSRRELRRELPSLKAGQPLNMMQARKEIDMANQINQFRSIVPVIRPGRKKGSMEMELKVQDRLPLSGSLELNNRYTSDTSHLRLMVSLDYGHLWQKHHSFGLGYQMSPENLDDVKVLNFNYGMPMSENSRLVLYGVDSNSEVATVTGGGDSLTVLGKGKIYGLRSLFSFPSSKNYFHRMLLGLAYKDFTENQNIGNNEGDVGFNVPIDYAAWSVTYSGSTRGELVSQFSVATNFGLRAFNDQADFDNKRFQSKANYFYINGQYSQFWNLSRHLHFMFELGGQYTDTPLISNEQYSAGGIDTVRGYTESSAIGDNAIKANIELSYILPDYYASKSIVSLFFDAVDLRTLEVLADANGEINSRQRLIGGGVGLNMTMMKNTNLQLFIAKPLKKLDIDNFDDGVRVHFSVSYHL